MCLGVEDHTEMGETVCTTSVGLDNESKKCCWARHLRARSTGRSKHLSTKMTVRLRYDRRQRGSAEPIGNGGDEADEDLVSDTTTTLGRCESSRDWSP